MILLRNMQQNSRVFECHHWQVIRTLISGRLSCDIIWLPLRRGPDSRTQSRPTSLRGLDFIEFIMQAGCDFRGVNNPKM